MRYVNYRICLDIQSGGSGVILTAKRGDTGRRLWVTLTDGGQPYLPGSDCFPVFTARKPDGHVVFNECTLEAGRVCYSLREQLLAVPGTVKCELRLYGSDGLLLTSAAFDLLVKNGSPSLIGIRPVAAALQRADRGGSLNTRELDRKSVV